MCVFMGHHIKCWDEFGIMKLVVLLPKPMDVRICNIEGINLEVDVVMCISMLDCSFIVLK